MKKVRFTPELAVIYVKLQLIELPQ